MSCQLPGSQDPSDLQSGKMQIQPMLNSLHSSAQKSAGRGMSQAREKKTETLRLGNLTRSSSPTSSLSPDTERTLDLSCLDSSSDGALTQR